MCLKDKVAIVTGASQAIDRVIACRMDAESARVVLTARNERNLQETSNLIAEVGGKGLVIPADFTDKNSLVNLVEKKPCRMEHDRRSHQQCGHRRPHQAV